jgi:hypothetical protein
MESGRRRRIIDDDDDDVDNQGESDTTEAPGSKSDIASASTDSLTKLSKDDTKPSVVRVLFVGL